MEGQRTGKICVLTEWPPYSDWERNFLERTLLREGINASEVTWLSVLKSRPQSGQTSRAPSGAVADGLTQCAAALRTHRPHVILACGGLPCSWLTGHTSVDKWQASVLEVSPDRKAEGLTGKVIPCYSTDRVAKDLSLQLWVSLCARKLKAESASPVLTRRPHVHLLNPPLEETLHLLRTHVRNAERISVDIETGRGQINTVGFAPGPDWAIAIGVLPDRLGASAYRELWSAITAVIESDQPKILQNFIYEHLFLSRYGLHLRAVDHDTMIAQKFLFPEFPMGLDAIGRMYSEMAYWKEDGKSWNNIRDWEAHYAYNCKDTCGTFEGFLGQEVELKNRGLSDLHSRYLSRLFPAIAEMCSRGLPVSETKLRALRDRVGTEYAHAVAELKTLVGAESLNPRSPAQIKAFLQREPRKYAIPKKYDSKEKKYKESTDEKSLKRLRMKYPQDPALPLLLKTAKLGKAQSAYLSFTYSEDHRMRFMINGHGTETGRFSGSKDPWGNGVNPQTVPGGSKGVNVKSAFEASPGFTFVQCDLRQAESRFVAYDSADRNLILALEDDTRDIHSEVGAQICIALGRDPTVEQKDAAKWRKTWRQLGKKSGHGANYSMKEVTFQDAVLSEMDLVLSRTEANKVLEAYHTLFPGIRQWHANIRKELALRRCLRTPLGRERHFFGRLDDDMFRQAYAYRPQSCIPDVTNHLMLHLLGLRTAGQLDFRLLLQCHDSLLMEVPKAAVSAVAEVCLQTKDWHPSLELPGGSLTIPTEIEWGNNWGELTKWERKNVG